MHKKHTLAFLAFNVLLCSPVVAQSCLPEGLDLLSQVQVNSFPTDYPGCTTIEGYLRINYVTDLTPLSQITAVEGYLQVGNNQITNLNGLENLSYVGGPLGIAGNAQLNNIDALSNLTAIGGSLEVNANPALASLSGLENVVTVGSDLRITENTMLADFQGLAGITDIEGVLEVRQNPALVSMQGLAPTSVGGGLTVRLNPLLEDLAAAQGLNSLGGGMFLFSNTALATLMDLQNITTINGSISIGQSPALTTLDGLGQIAPSTITNLSITNCPGLSQCAVASVCSYLTDPNNAANIINNATGCADRAEVENACSILSVDDALHANRILTIFPNPSSGQVTLKADGTGVKTLTVFDTAGRSVHEERLTATAEASHTINLSHLTPGTYTLRIQHGIIRATARLIRY